MTPRRCIPLRLRLWFWWADLHPADRIAVDIIGLLVASVLINVLAEPFPEARMALRIIATLGPLVLLPALFLGRRR